MELIKLSCKTNSGKQTSHQLIMHEQAKGTVIMLPGSNNNSDQPIFHLSRKAILDAGYNVVNIDYSHILNGKPTEAIEQEIEDLVLRLIEKLKNHTSAPVIALIGRSLGSVISGRLLSKGLEVDKVVLLSPVQRTIDLFQDVPVQHGLLITSENDKYMDQDTIGRIKELDSFESLIYTTAAHNLEIEGDVDATMQIITETVNKIFHFVETDPIRS